MKYTQNYNLKKPEGTDAVNIDDLNYNADVLDAQLKAVSDMVDNNKALSFTGTLSTTGWNGTSAPYTQTVTINGILASAPPPAIDVELSSTWSTALQQEEAWALIKRVAYADNSLTFYADAKPTVALNFKGVQVK